MGLGISPKHWSKPAKEMVKKISPCIFDENHFPIGFQFSIDLKQVTLQMGDKDKYALGKNDVKSFILQKSQVSVVDHELYSVRYLPFARFEFCFCQEIAINVNGGYLSAKQSEETRHTPRSKTDLKQPFASKINSCKIGNCNCTEASPGWLSPLAKVL